MSRERGATSKRLKPSAIYLAAAQVMEKHYDERADHGFPSCWALNGIPGGFKAKHAYQDFMLNGQTDVTVLWGRGNEYSAETNAARILLFCFMAAVAKDKERANGKR